MRFILVFLFNLIAFNSYSQSETLFLEVNNQFVNNNDPKNIGVYELQLKINNEKTNDTDYYNFIINTDNEKTFIQNGTEFIGEQFLTIDNLKRKTFCEIHDLLSSSKRICLVQKVENKYKYWITMYVGTYRNMEITKPGKI